MFKEAQSQLRKAMPGLLVSPQAHFYASLAAGKLGDAAAAARETSLGKKCLAALLQTGNGSPEKPYLVTFVSDEYDILHALTKRAKLQAVISKDGKSFDRIECEDGTELWFERHRPSWNTSTETVAACRHNGRHPAGTRSRGVRWPPLVRREAVS